MFGCRLESSYEHRDPRYHRIAITNRPPRRTSAGEHGAQFYAHYYLWRVYVVLGDEERADLEKNAACYYVRYLDEATAQTKEIREFLDPLEVSR